MDKFYEGTLVLDGERIFTRDEIIETLKRNSDTISGYNVILLHRRIIKGDMILTALKYVLSVVGVIGLNISITMKTVLFTMGWNLLYCLSNLWKHCLQAIV